MTKLTITKIFKKERTSARTGKPYISLSIQTKEYGSRYLSGFGSKETDKWKEGDVVELDVTESEKTDKDNKPYLNWKLVEKPDEVAQLAFSVAKHDMQIKEIQSFLRSMFPNKMGVKKDDYPQYTGQPNFDVDEVNAELGVITIED